MYKRQESALGRRRQELDREAAQILKEKSAAQDLLAQAQEDADVLRATARREQEEILENARRQSAEILQKARTEAAEILRQAETEKIRQMEQMRDEMSEAKRQLGSMAGRIGNLSKELERFGVFLAQQNETSANRKEKSSGERWRPVLMESNRQSPDRQLSILCATGGTLIRRRSLKQCG